MSLQLLVTQLRHHELHAAITGHPLSNSVNSLGTSDNDRIQPVRYIHLTPYLQLGSHQPNVSTNPSTIWSSRKLHVCVNKNNKSNGNENVGAFGKTKVVSIDWLTIITWTDWSCSESAFDTCDRESVTRHTWSRRCVHTETQRSTRSRGRWSKRATLQAAPFCNALPSTVPLPWTLTNADWSHGHLQTT